MILLHLAYPLVPFLLLPILLAAFVYKLFFYKSPRYVYSLGKELSLKNLTASTFYKKILTFIRLALLAVIVFLVARPQWVDKTRSVNLEGVAIALALDVSGSMECFDDLRDRRTRLEIAKNEATKFIMKRTNDPISIVLFGKKVFSKSPLTHDKSFLVDIVSGIKMGEVDPDGTSLNSAIACCINRLKKSNAKSKIIVMLTDGVPMGDTIATDDAIKYAKEFGIKIYTIGIGREGGGYLSDRYGSIGQMPDSIDMKLLQRIAKETNGAAFRAHNAQELNEIYSKIDALEKTKNETTVFQHYYEAYANFIFLVVLLILLELLLKLFIWRGI